MINKNWLLAGILIFFSTCNKQPEKTTPDPKESPIRANTPNLHSDKINDTEGETNSYLIIDKMIIILGSYPKINFVDSIKNTP